MSYWWAYFSYLFVLWWTIIHDRWSSCMSWGMVNVLWYLRLNGIVSNISIGNGSRILAYILKKTLLTIIYFSFAKVNTYLGTKDTLDVKELSSWKLPSVVFTSSVRSSKKRFLFIIIVVLLCLHWSGFRVLMEVYHCCSTVLNHICSSAIRQVQGWPMTN